MTFLYYSGSIMGQVLHASIKISSSSLNDHFFKRNLVDSSSCSCGLIESTAFLLHGKTMTHCVMPLFSQLIIQLH